MKRLPPNPTTHRSTKACTLGRSISDTSFGTNEEIFDLLVHLGFFPRKPSCKFCGHALNTDAGRKLLHFSFQCTRCGKSTYVLEASQLSGVESIRLFFRVTVTFVTGGKVSELKAETHIQHRTWAKYRDRLQNVIDLTIERMEASGDLMLGGPRIVVEIDECHLFTPKYHRGNPPSGSALWVVGIIERDNPEGRRCIFLLTENRSAKVLEPFIKKWVRPGSILISDEWKGYTKDLDQFYTRATVCHKREFAHHAVVDGLELSVNTNHIEREWREVRKVLMSRDMSSFTPQLNKEIFRHLFLAGKPVEQHPYIMLQKMAELVKKKDS